MSQNNDKLLNAFPKIDVKFLIEAQQKNLEAFVKIASVLNAGTQSILTRQMEIVNSCWSAGLGIAQDPKNFDVNKVIVNTQAAAEKTVADVRDIAGIATEASTKAFEVLRSRTDEAVGEIKTLFKIAA